MQPRSPPPSRMKRSRSSHGPLGSVVARTSSSSFQLDLLVPAVGEACATPQSSTANGRSRPPPAVGPLLASDGDEHREPPDRARGAGRQPISSTLPAAGSRRGSNPRRARRRPPPRRARRAGRAPRRPRRTARPRQRGGQLSPFVERHARDLGSKPQHPGEAAPVTPREVDALQVGEQPGHDRPGADRRQVRSSNELRRPCGCANRARHPSGSSRRPSKGSAYRSRDMASRTRKWPGIPMPTIGTPMRRPVSMATIPSVIGMPRRRSMTSFEERVARVVVVVAVAGELLGARRVVDDARERAVVTTRRDLVEPVDRPPDVESRVGRARRRAARPGRAGSLARGPARG